VRGGACYFAAPSLSRLSLSLVHTLEGTSSFLILLWRGTGRAGWSEHGAEVVVLLEWGDWLHNGGVLDTMYVRL